MSHPFSVPDLIDIDPMAAPKPPSALFHGTTGIFDDFDDRRLGTASGHPSGGLGHFFSASADIARTFCLREEILDRGYDSPRGSKSLLDARWLSVQGDDLYLPQSAVLTVELSPERTAVIAGGAFAELCDTGVGDREWAALRDRLLENDYDSLLVRADVSAARAGELCLEYLADTWVALVPGIARIKDRNPVVIHDPPAPAFGP